MSDETRPAAETLEQFRIISELVADYAFSCGVTPDGALPIEWATDSLARVTGYTKDEINRRGWQALIHPDDLPIFEQELDRLRAGQGKETKAQRYTKKIVIFCVVVPLWRLLLLGPPENLCLLRRDDDVISATIKPDAVGGFAHHQRARAL